MCRPSTTLRICLTTFIGTSSIKYLTCNVALSRHSVGEVLTWTTWTACLCWPRGSSADDPGKLLFGYGLPDAALILHCDCLLCLASFHSRSPPKSKADTVQQATLFERRESLERA